jgi:hypothetical protein
MAMMSGPIRRDITFATLGGLEMGFTLYYRSTRQVDSAEAEAIKRDAIAACEGRTWLSSEPVSFFLDLDDGYLLGGSKPNFQPHPDDADSAASSGLPDGTTNDVIDVLCQLSRDHGIDWQFSHEAAPGPIGYVRAGVCDDEVLASADMFADLGDILAGELGDFSNEDLA